MEVYRDVYKNMKYNEFYGVDTSSVDESDIGAFEPPRYLRDSHLHSCIKMMTPALHGVLRFKIYIHHDLTHRYNRPLHFRSV